MTQNVYDNPEFFEGYSQLGRSVEGLDGAAEWASIRALLPELKGKRVADLGCGFGWFCRYARQAGATEVLGFDVSQNMLARARATTADDAVTYARADLEELELAKEAFDLVYSSLAFHYIKNLDALLARVHAALVPGGRLVFSIEHPIYMAPAHPGWSNDVDGRATWPVNGYLDEGPRTTDWLAKGVVKQHRTMGTLLNILIGFGFTLLHVEEWGPSLEQVAAHPEWAEERERPMFLLVSARK
ncbi:methyltransferase domain-containing protein [Pararhizobium sp. BT-229]|uniref:class I SAM-dependent methyltransferase n=1 Tax=Pararhizobium sp. BT-229 TaxID=2986923 RepID=UPI0021F77BD6|nr:class I SAM-dependent methyltransferase [Pararhizobium sp. BT-229]MCV9966495.1 methyltransferase domain-containing protein [Pararhizobium sp. BT-229]